MSHISEWLTQNGFDAYVDLFESKKIGLDVLQDLTDENLRELEIPLGDRKRLLHAFSCTPAPAESSRQITVMICDLKDSTLLTNTLKPEEYRNCLKYFQDTCKRSIEKFEGHVFQYRGDEVIAYFGYPLALELIAVRAAHAATDIVSSLNSYPIEENQSRPELHVRVGIATGEVIVGGTQERATGPAPNLASRLHGLADPDGIVICDLTHTLSDKFFASEEFTTPKLKGFDEELQAHKLLGPNAGSPLDYIGKNKALTPLTGRKSELELLESAYGQSNRTMRFVHLTGEAGIGKSRLIREFDRSQKESPIYKIHYFCSPFHTNSSLHPIKTYLNRALNLRTLKGEDEKIFSLRKYLKNIDCDDRAISHALASLLEIELETNSLRTLNPKVLKAKQLSAIRSTIRAMSERGKVLIVLEDAHWIDPTTLEFLTKLVDSEKMQNIFLVLSSRPEFRWPITSQVQPISIYLNELSLSESKQLAFETAGTEQLHKDVIEKIVNISGGNPFYIEETTKAIIDSGQLDIPATLKDLLLVRLGLDTLGNLKDTVLTASVIGEEFSEILLQLVMEAEGPVIHRDLSFLVEKGTFNSMLTAQGSQYHFSHALLRNAAYGHLLQSERENIHGRVAKVMVENLPGGPAFEPEIIAHHYSCASLHDQAAEQWRIAGRIAKQKGALSESVSHYESCLRSLEKVEENLKVAQRKVRVMGSLADVLHATMSYRSDEAKKYVEQALKLCDIYGLASDMAKFKYDIWIGIQGNGKHEVALKYANDFLMFSEKYEDPKAQGVALGCVAWSEFNLGNPKTAMETLLKSADLLDQQDGKPMTRTELESSVGRGCGLVQALWCLGDQRYAEETSNKTVASALESKNIISIFLSYQYAGCLFHSLCRNWKIVDHYALSLIELAEKNDFQQAALPGRLYHNAMIIRESGNRKSFETGVKMIEGAQSLGYLYMMPYWFSVLGDACISQGLLKEGHYCLDQAMKIIDESNEHWHLPEIYRLHGELAEKEPSDNELEAHEWYTKAILLAKKQKAKNWELRATESLNSLNTSTAPTN